MSHANAVALDRTEIDDVLKTVGIGVISFAERDEPYSIPVSYGYDGDNRELYFRLSVGPDSEKSQFVADGESASFVVTDDGDEGWRSVVARGTLSSVAEPTLDGRAADQLHEIDIAWIPIYDAHPGELSFDLYRLDPAEYTGRKEQ